MLTTPECEPLVATPMIVAFVLPAGAAADAVSVSVANPPADMLDALKTPLTPAGKPVTASAIVCDTPEITAVETVTTRLVPRASEIAPGNTVIAKSFRDGATTVMLRTDVCVPLEAVPVIVTLALPRAAAAVAFKVIVALPPAVTLAGLMLPVTPAGRPLSDSETDCAAPAVTAV